MTSEKTAAARFGFEQRENLTVEAIAAVELYGDGMLPAEMAPTPQAKDTLIDGLVLYAQLLEATVAVLRGGDVGDPKVTRASARQSAGMWRHR